MLDGGLRIVFWIAILFSVYVTTLVGLKITDKNFKAYIRIPLRIISYLLVPLLMIGIVAFILFGLIYGYDENVVATITGDRSGIAFFINLAFNRLIEYSIRKKKFKSKKKSKISQILETFVTSVIVLLVVSMFLLVLLSVNDSKQEDNLEKNFGQMRLERVENGMFRSTRYYSEIRDRKYWIIEAKYTLPESWDAYNSNELDTIERDSIKKFCTETLAESIFANNVEVNIEFGTRHRRYHNSYILNEDYCKNILK